jgi:hypothetical protein
MVNYKAIQKFLTEKISPSLHFTPRRTNLLKPLSGICLAVFLQRTSLALQELGYYIFSVKQMTAKRLTLEGRVTQTSLSLVLITLAGNEISQETIKLTPLCNIIIKVEVCRSQNGLTQCFNCQRFGHIWVHCRQPPRSLWCRGGHCHRECPEKQNSESGLTCCNCNLKDGESPHPGSYRGCNHAKQEVQCKKDL